MRDIKFLTIHHSLTPSTIELSKAVNSFNNTHKAKLHPNPNGYGLHVAYHYVIGSNGKVMKTRPESEVGFHASNLEINNKSIGICLNGNYDKETPTKEMVDSLKALVKDICSRYNIIAIEGHRKYAPKSCPGKNITDEFIHSLLVKEEKLDEYQKWMVDNKLCQNANWYNPITKYEFSVMLNRYDKMKSLFKSNKNEPSV